jgi:hypothetical protein
MKSGIELIAAERMRQMNIDGYTPEHDDKHTDGELVDAALVYGECSSIQARGATGAEIREVFDEGEPYAQMDWPWRNQEGQYDHLKIEDDRIFNLVKSGALIAAEIDREIRARCKGDLVSIPVPQVKRLLQWNPKGGQLAAVLCSPTRNDEIEQFIGKMIENKASLREVITALNERGDLTDGEWTCAIFALGVFQGMNGF